MHNNLIQSALEREKGEVARMLVMVQRRTMMTCKEGDLPNEHNAEVEDLRNN